MMQELKMIKEIQTRYAAESNNLCNLSCGNNLGFLKIMPGEKILDLGCGKGSETIQSAIQAGPDGKAIGIDITRAMIDKAKLNAAKTGLSNISFIKGNIENLPFDHDVFDAVMSNCVINHAKNKKKVYQEIFRVLKNGGRFVISDLVTKKELPMDVKKDPKAWAQCFGGAVTKRQYLNMIVSSGFDSLKILNQREYLKNDYEFMSLTIMAIKKDVRREPQFVKML